MITLGELVSHKAIENKGKTFLCYEDDELSYQDIEANSNKIANAFIELGVSKGDHVGIMLPNCPEYILCWFGLAKLGAVTVAINNQLRGEGLRDIIKASESKFLVVAPEFLPQYQEVAAGLKETVCLALTPNNNDSTGVGGLNKLIAEKPPTQPQEVTVRDNEPFIITLTSGTTGLPKLVRNSHRAYILSAEDLARYTEIASDDRIYTHLPLYHANPQVYCVLTALVANASIILAARFSASRFWEDIENYRATAFSYVGAVLPILLAQPERDEDGHNPVKKCFGGGAPKHVYDAFTRRFDIEVLELYGMSETGVWNTINRPGRGKSGTVGTMREGFEIKVFDDDDREVPVDHVGEIVIRPQKPYIMFDGYYRNAEETAKCSGNWWFHTGDLGKVDSDGYYYFCGRKKETIRRGGENISPGDIESVVNRYPGVLECAAVGVADPIMEEEVKVAVVPMEDCRIEPQDLLAWCRNKLPKFMVPRYIEIVEELPKSASEKIQRTVLKERGITSRTWDARKRARCCLAKADFYT